MPHLGLKGVTVNQPHIQRAQHARVTPFKRQARTARTARVTRFDERHVIHLLQGAACASVKSTPVIKRPAQGARHIFCGVTQVTKARVTRVVAPQHGCHVISQPCLRRRSCWRRQQPPPGILAMLRHPALQCAGAHLRCPRLLVGRPCHRLQLRRGLPAGQLQRQQCTGPLDPVYRHQLVNHIHQRGARISHLFIRLTWQATLWQGRHRLIARGNGHRALRYWLRCGDSRQCCTGLFNLPGSQSHPCFLRQIVDLVFQAAATPRARPCWHMHGRQLVACAPLCTRHAGQAGQLACSAPGHLLPPEWWCWRTRLMVRCLGQIVATGFPSTSLMRVLIRAETDLPCSTCDTVVRDRPSSSAIAAKVTPAMRSSAFICSGCILFNKTS